MQKLKHEQIQYIEFHSPDLEKIKKFYIDAFGWTFTDYGPDYIGFEGEYVDGGFAPGEVRQGSVLVVLYSQKIEETFEKVKSAGGKISKDFFSFPGGRRFHFTDPDGNELAVWTDT